MTWRMYVESFGKVVPATEQMALCESIGKKLALPGPIRMKDPSLQIYLLFDYGHIGESASAPIL